MKSNVEIQQKNDATLVKVQEWRVHHLRAPSSLALANLSADDTLGAPLVNQEQVENYQFEDE